MELHQRIRTRLFLLVLAFILISTVLAAYWMAPKPSAVPRFVQTELLDHKAGHKQPPPCGSYGQPPKNKGHGNVQNKNKHCAPPGAG